VLHDRFRLSRAWYWKSPRPQESDQYGCRLAASSSTTEPGILAVITIVISGARGWRERACQRVAEGQMMFDCMKLK
jgi:hypothetical protein